MDASTAGPLERVRLAGGHGARLLALRSQLALAELDAARLAWLRWVVMALVAVAVGAVALAALTAAASVLLWPWLGWAGPALFGVLHALIAWRIAWQLRVELAREPPLLSSTREALAGDLRTLFGRGAAPANDARASTPRGNH